MSKYIYTNNQNKTRIKVSKEKSQGYYEMSEK